MHHDDTVGAWDELATGAPRGQRVPMLDSQQVSVSVVQYDGRAS
jgi:hypothetical protein